MSLNVKGELRKLRDAQKQKDADTTVRLANDRARLTMALEIALEALDFDPLQIKFLIETARSSNGLDDFRKFLQPVKVSDRSG